MNIDYIAGFFDGEGSFGLYGKIKRPKVSITQTDFDILEKIRIFLGMGQVYKLSKRKDNWKDSWIFTITNREDCLKFVKLIKPHLLLERKIKKAEEIIDELENYLENNKLYKSERDTLKQKVIELSLQGFSCREIEKKLPLSRTTVSRMLNE